MNAEAIRDIYGFRPGANAGVLRGPTVSFLPPLLLVCARLVFSCTRAGGPLLSPASQAKLDLGPGALAILRIASWLNLSAGLAVGLSLVAGQNPLVFSRKARS